MLDEAVKEMVQLLAFRQDTISSLRRSITATTRRQAFSPKGVRVSTTPRPSVVLASLCTNPWSTRTCAARLAWPLLRLACRAS